MLALLAPFFNFTLPIQHGKGCSHIIRGGYQNKDWTGTGLGLGLDCMGLDWVLYTLVWLGSMCNRGYVI